MNYQDMIVIALQGRSVTAAAKAWGVPQPTLNRYVRGERMPDYSTGLKIARDAGVEPGEAFEVFAEEERSHKVKNFKLQMGFTDLPLIATVAGLMFTVTLFLTPSRAEAHTYAACSNPESSCLYIM